MKSIVMTKACSVINAAGIYERFTPEHGVYTLDDATANKLLSLNGYAEPHVESKPKSKPQAKAKQVFSDSLDDGSEEADAE